MNIFALHNDPAEAARMHLDKHVVKMVVEYAQLLSTAHRLLDGRFTIVVHEKVQKRKQFHLLPGEVVCTRPTTSPTYPLKLAIENPKCYSATHANHPCAVWARASSSNYDWLYQLFQETAAEYTHRYGRIHKTWADIGEFLKSAPSNIEPGALTEFALAMPDEYKVKNDPVASYRNYYNGSKARFAAWTKREPPSWFNPKETYSDRNTTKPA